MKKKVAVITGIAGQDGAYLADFLLEKGYRVVGIVKSTSKDKLWRLDYFNILSKTTLARGDILDRAFVNRLMKKYQPNEVYNLAGQSRVGQSWADPAGTFKVNALAVINLLEALRQVSPRSRFFQASSAEMYGEAKAIITEKTTQFAPLNPYGASKLAAHLTVRNWRHQYSLFACSGILFNHESPLRESDMVTKKIISGAACVSLGLVKKIELGNTDVVRDWGFAGDFVEAMWRMLQQNQPRDFVICTGVSLPIKDFIKEAFSYVGIRNWRKYIRINPSFFRKSEVRSMRGSNQKIKSALKWRPKADLRRLIKIMADHELTKLNGSSNKR